jgi:DNA primase
MDILEALNQAGISYIVHQSKEGEIWIDCPFCVDNGTTPDYRKRLGLNVITGLGHCFNCDWRSTNKDYTFRMLAQKLATGELEAAESTGAPKKLPERIELPISFTRLSPDKGDYWMLKAWRFVQSKGVSTEQIKHFRIGFCESGEFAYRVILPAYWCNKLVGVISRDITGQQKPKYRNSIGAKVIYGIERIRYDTAVLGEGPFDRHAIKRVCPNFDVGALLGHSLTDVQAEILKPYKHIILWLDPDKAGIEGAITVARRLKKKKNVWFVMPDAEDERDPDELTDEERLYKLQHLVRHSTALEMKLKAMLAFKE